MFMFIIYAFILYVCSIGGSFFIKKDSKVFSIKNIIGFCSFLGILQIIYYPLQYFKVGSIYFHIITLVITLIFFILGCIKIKKEDFNFIKKYEFWILLLLVFVIIKIIPGMEAGDDSFYMSLFIDNADINKINTIDPRVGLLGKIDSVYLYQGYYSLMSFLYKVQNIIFPNSIDNIFVSFRSTMSLLSVLFASQILIYVKEKFLNKDNKKVYYLIQFLSILLVAVLEWCHIYWGSFMLFQIYVPLFMIIFSLYLEDNKYKYLLFVINLASIALASSSLFLFAIISFAYFVYELFKKEVKCENYYFILLPSMIYVAFLFDKIWLLLVFGILCLVVLSFKDKINEIVNNYLKYIIIILPIVFFIIGILGDYKFSIETYRVGKTTLLYNLVIIVYTLYLIIKKEKINPILFVFLIISIFFFNPLVEPFVSHYLTSTYVYYRLFYITKNPFVVTVVFLSIYDTIKKSKIKLSVPIYILCLFILIINYGYHLCKDTILLDNYNIKYNYLLREDIYSKELGKEVKKLKSGSNIFSVYFAPRIYNKDLVTTVARYPYDYSWYKDIMVRSLYREDTLTEEEYGWFNAEVKNKKYDYLITYNDSIKLKKLKTNDYTIIYKNDIFVLIECEV